MGDVIPIHSSRIFLREEAEFLLPVIRRVTERAALDASELEEQLRFVPDNEPLYNRLQNEMDLIIKRWAIKISRLGCEPRGVWLVDFNTGNGWFSWRYNDDGLNYFDPCSTPLSEPANPERNHEGDLNA